MSVKLLDLLFVRELAQYVSAVLNHALLALNLKQIIVALPLGFVVAQLLQLKPVGVMHVNLLATRALAVQQTILTLLNLQLVAVVVHQLQIQHVLNQVLRVLQQLLTTVTVVQVHTARVQQVANVVKPQLVMSVRAAASVEVHKDISLSSVLN